ncbi:hypothetical protein CRUP_037243 [Coryphaenoides rupestris]|nr:hypothetical protein CRUP_037243 [Coryphaenoides rupestris]
MLQQPEQGVEGDAADQERVRRSDVPSDAARAGWPGRVATATGESGVPEGRRSAEGPVGGAAAAAAAMPGGASTSHLKQLRWKKRPSALSLSITYTRLWQKKQTSLPPIVTGNSFLREPCGAQEEEEEENTQMRGTRTSGVGTTGDETDSFNCCQISSRKLPEEAGNADRGLPSKDKTASYQVPRGPITQNPPRRAPSETRSQRLRSGGCPFGGGGRTVHLGSGRLAFKPTGELLRPLLNTEQSGEDRGDTELWRRARERCHCSTKKREGFFLGFPGQRYLLPVARQSLALHHLLVANAELLLLLCPPLNQQEVP